MANLFNPGNIVTTTGIYEILNSSQSEHDFVRNSLVRHLSGDWGNCSPEDIEANNQALKNGSRLFSSYINGDLKIWIITESDRSVTTILFPDEY